MPRGSTSRGRCYRRPVPLIRRQRDDARHADSLRGARFRLDVSDQRDDLLADERLLLEQRVRETVEGGAMLLEEADGFGVRAVGEPRLFLVAETLRLLRERVVVGPHRA